MANTRWSYGSFSSILCKQFWWWPSELSQIAWHLHDQQLTLGQSVLLPMQTWKWYTFKMLQMSAMLVSHPIKIKAMQFCSSLFDKLWRDGVPLTRSLFFASCHQLNIKSLGGNHNLCHICRGYMHCECESFYRVKSWMIETSHSVQSNSYCSRTPGAQSCEIAVDCSKEDAKVLNSCASAWSWKLWSRSAWSKRWAWNLKRLWFEAVFVSTWRMMNFECCRLARAQASTYGWNRKCQYMAHVTETGWGRTPWTRAPKANHELWNDDRSILFYSCPGQMKYCKVQHRQLTLGQFVLLPMQGWKWPVLEMLGIPGTCLSRHWITAMNVCDSRFNRLWHGAQVVSQPFLILAAAQSAARMRLPQSYLACLQNLHLDVWCRGRVQH